MNTTEQNREAWLISAVKAMTPWFGEIENAEVPAIRISVGWPGGRAKKTITRGQCWASHAAEDKIAQIFVSPAWVDTRTILAVVLHEMIHAVDDCKSGHRGNFIRIARALGFRSAWTSADNRTEELDERLAGLIERLGDFPSGALTTGEAADTPKKQATRMLKIECPNCGCVARMAQSWIDFGLPTCACGTEMEQPV